VLSKFLACFGFYILLWLPTLVYLPVLVDWKQPVWQPAWTVYSILWVGGMAGMVLAVLLALLPFGSGGRIVALGLLVAGCVSAGVGAWCHYHYDAEHLLEVPVGIDPMPVLSSYLGLALAGAMFLALGLLVSSLVRSQLV